MNKAYPDEHPVTTATTMKCAGVRKSHGCVRDTYIVRRRKMKKPWKKLLDTAKSLDDSFAKREASAQCNGISSSIAALEQLQICRLQNSSSNSLSAVPTPQQHFELPVVPVTQDNKIVKPNELKDDEHSCKHLVG